MKEVRTSRLKRQKSFFANPIFGFFLDMDKLSKMNNLLEILSNPSKRTPMETLLKCEIVLENFTKRGDSSVGPPVTTLKENHFFSPLLEAVSTHLQSPVANHTLQRTFGPYLEVFFGPEIKCVS